MGFFDKLLGKSDEAAANDKAAFPWQNLTDTTDLASLTAASNEKLVVVFKHSTRCGISRMALRQFENSAPTSEAVAYYLLDLLQHRAASQAIAQDWKVMHESPQLLIVKNGELVHHASHSAIDGQSVAQQL